MFHVKCNRCSARASRRVEFFTSWTSYYQRTEFNSLTPKKGKFVSVSKTNFINRQEKKTEQMLFTVGRRC